MWPRCSCTECDALHGVSGLPARLLHYCSIGARPSCRPRMAGQQQWPARRCRSCPMRRQRQQPQPAGVVVLVMLRAAGAPLCRRQSSSSSSMAARQQRQQQQQVRHTTHPRAQAWRSSSSRRCRRCRCHSSSSSGSTGTATATRQTARVRRTLLPALLASAGAAAAAGCGSRRPLLLAAAAVLPTRARQRCGPRLLLLAAAAARALEPAHRAREVRVRVGATFRHRLLWCSSILHSLRLPLLTDSFCCLPAPTHARTCAATWSRVGWWHQQAVRTLPCRARPLDATRAGLLRRCGAAWGMRCPAWWAAARSTAAATPGRAGARRGGVEGLSRGGARWGPDVDEAVNAGSSFGAQNGRQPPAWCELGGRLESRVCLKPSCLHCTPDTHTNTHVFTTAQVSVE